jgi:hypothetical protein
MFFTMQKIIPFLLIFIGCTTPEPKPVIPYNDPVSDAKKTEGLAADGKTALASEDTVELHFSSLSAFMKSGDFPVKADNIMRFRLLVRTRFCGYVQGFPAIRGGFSL